MPVDVSFVTSGHDVADARLHRLAAAARRVGLTVEVLGLGSAQDAPSAEHVTATPRGSFVRRALLATRYAGAARGRVLIALDPDSPATVLVSHHVEEIPPGVTHAMLLRGGRVVDAGPVDDVVTEETLSETFGMPLLLTRADDRFAARRRPSR